MKDVPAPEFLVNVGGPELKRNEFLRIRELARSQFGLDLRDGKERLVASRLAKHVRTGGFGSFSDYVDSVVADRTGESLINLINALSTNHTNFFREMRHFDFMAKTILPSAAGRDFRVWSAACATGEEPYSIALSSLEQPVHLRPRNIHILASDISTKALQSARTGMFSKERMDGVPPLMQSRYFLDRGNQTYELKTEVKALVEFRRINLMEPFPGGCEYDLIFCRNVMIYFERSVQRDLVRRLADRLRPGGFLFVGHSESLTGLQTNLEYVEPAIHRKPGRGEPVRGKR